MWIVERPAQPRSHESHSIYSETGERKRQAHKKSRNGCAACRQRRIKCDEQRPTCGYCLKVRRQCCYPPCTIASKKRQYAGSKTCQPDSDAWLLNTSTKGYLLRALESADQLDPDLADFAPALRLHAIESLNHFVTCDLSWLKARKVQVLMQKPAISLVIDNQYLLHAVLAISNAHLAFLKPAEKSYDTAARLHWQHSMRLYSPRFRNGFETEDVNAIYFASQLHAMLSFMFIRLPVRNSTREWTADWLVAMRYKWLLFNTPIVVGRLRLGMWEPLVQAHYSWLDRSRRRLTANSDHTYSVEIEAILKYSDENRVQRSWFHEEQLQYLRMLERVPPIIDAIGAFLSFITEAPVEYITSLQDRDPYSLLMLLYWTTIVGRVEQWWLATAANAEHGNLLQYLEKLDDANLVVVLNVLNARSISSLSHPQKTSTP